MATFTVVRLTDCWDLLERYSLSCLLFFVLKKSSFLPSTFKQGKTTLLEVLSGSLQRGLTASSSIYINASAASVPISYTVAQHVEENVIGCLTVGQILRYAFLFKNGLFTANGGEARRKHIAKVLHQLMLPEAILRTRYDRCSGGEMKRVAIAQVKIRQDFHCNFSNQIVSGIDVTQTTGVSFCCKLLIVWGFILQLTISPTRTKEQPD